MTLKLFSRKVQRQFQDLEKVTWLLDFGSPQWKRFVTFWERSPGFISDRHSGWQSVCRWLNCFVNYFLDREPRIFSEMRNAPMLSHPGNCTLKRFHALHKFFMEDLLQFDLNISKSLSILLKKNLYLHLKVSKAVFQANLNFRKEF